MKGLIFLLAASLSFSTSAIAQSDEVLSEWNGIRLNKTTQEEFFKKWPLCKNHFDFHMRADEHSRVKIPAKGRGCMFTLQEGPISNVQLFAKDSILTAFTFDVKKEYSKEYLAEFKKKYGPGKTVTDGTCIENILGEWKSSSGWYWTSDKFEVQGCDFTSLYHVNAEDSVYRFTFARKLTPDEKAARKKQAADLIKKNQQEAEDQKAQKTKSIKNSL